MSKARRLFFSSKSFWFTTLNYLPGLIMLVVSMMALHFSVALIREKNTVFEIYRIESTTILELENYLYWSVIAVGLCGFILVLLNADKLIKLSAVNAEKKTALQLLENRLAAMEATYDGIGIVNADGNLTYMNRALMNLHGISESKKDQFLDQPWTNLYTEKGKQNIDQAVMPSVLDQGYWRGNSPIVRQDGTVVQTELSLTRLADGGFIGTARDITDKIKAEDEKKELEGQFYQAQKMEAVGRLAGGIAHDFNNILAAMNGYAEFLIDDLEEGSAEQGFAQNILQAGRQARSLVDQMLAFSRRKDSDFDKMDLMIPLQESLSMLKASLPKTIEVNQNLEIDHAYITGNDTQISQVIMNLCVNARDAMEGDKGQLKIQLKDVQSEGYEGLGLVRASLPDKKDTPAIRIDDLSEGHSRLLLGHVAQGTNYISLSVADTGTGMSRKIMEHIFEPFFTTKPVDKGTGLGLATVHGVIASHQGAMIIDSILGQGTRFELLFPMMTDLKDEEEDVDFEYTEDIDARILLVEDQQEVRDMMLNMLERLGFEAYSCESGMEALEVLRENPDQFDLVITDHNMPIMTGRDLVYQVSIDNPDLPFIILSGHGERELENLMEDLPSIKFYIRKPASKEELKDKIARILAMVEAQNKAA